MMNRNMLLDWINWFEQGRNLLVEAVRVGVLVLFDDGDDEGDEFGPEVQVLDVWTLLIWGHRFCLHHRLDTSEIYKYDPSAELQQFYFFPCRD